MRYLNPVKLKFIFLSILLLTSCAIKRPTPDFKELQELENVNSSPVESSSSDTQMEFPITPGASAPSAEKMASKRPGITLVLGGAGVASFATVGLLKRLKSEGIKVDLIVASGWPSVFALGYGFLRTVHDLEWFAMRLEEVDFKKLGSGKKEKDLGTVSKLVESFFKKSDIKEARLPLVLVTRDIESGNSDVYDSGNWSEALLKTFAVPGLYRPFPEKRFEGIPLGVGEAQKRTNSPVFVIRMYSDYFAFSKEKPQTLAAFQNALKEEASRGDLNLEVKLSGGPLDYSKKRAAILAGSQVGGQIAKRLSQ